MLRELEETIARGGDIGQTKRRLLDKAHSDYMQLCAQIEHDARIAELIVYALRNEPTYSPGYGVARGLQRRLAREYPNDDKLARDLRKAAWDIGEGGAKDGTETDDQQSGGTD